MNPKKRILEFLNDPKCGHSDGDQSEHFDKIQRIRDGMSEGTATLVIDQALNDKHSGEYSIEALENKGRYYTASIVNFNGRVIQRMLVDKQSGTVRFM